MSHITVPAAKVIEAASKVLKRIEERRAEEDEKAIKVTMREKTRYIFGRTLTREEAIQRLRDNYPYSLFPSFYAWGTKDRVSKLLILAQHGDPVVIDADDAEMLWRG